MSSRVSLLSSVSFFFFNDTATTEIYTLSLHDALPIWTDRPVPVQGRAGGRGRRAVHRAVGSARLRGRGAAALVAARHVQPAPDRKSTRLNSSHMSISYAVFCLKKKKKNIKKH